ncbi:sigma-70 family RNA polymerase sigma factor [Spirillospora sp. NPDC047279]|uniref:sigma-70 family RNA polymerase sigma factor n=1 Tax=Spirillospora sp. NPDC047279 TaxID=3155478 RepID=UPI0034113378
MRPLTQKTLIKVFLAWPHLDHRKALTGFTRTVMVRAFISERRAARWSRELLVEHSPEPEPSDTCQHGDDTQLLLEQALATLGPRQRAVVVLRHWELLTVSEVADTLSCSPTTVRSQTSRALTALRSWLGRSQRFRDAGDDACSDRIGLRYED